MEVLAFLKSAFYMFFHMSITASMIGGVIWIIKNILKNYISYNWISKIWILFLVVLIIPISIRTRISIYNLIPLSIKNNQEKILDIGKTTMTNGDNSSQIETDDVKNMPNKENVKNVDAGDVISIIWATITSILIIYMSISLYLIHRAFINEECEKQDNDFTKRLNNILLEAKEKIKVSQNVNVLISDNIDVPSLVGVFSPKIIINMNIQSLSEEELRSIIYHEVGHLKRRDNILIIIINILKSIYFFNPAIIFLLNSLMEDVEIATDEEALFLETNEIRKAYCRALIEVSSSNKIIFTSFNSFGKNRKVIERRIDHIRKIDFLYNNRRAKYISIATIVIIFLLFGTQSSTYLPRLEVMKLIEKGSEISNYSYQINQTEKDTNDHSFAIANIKNDIMVKRFYNQDKTIERIIYHKLFEEKIDYLIENNTYDYISINKKDFFETPNQEILEKIKDYSQYDFLFLGTKNIEDVKLYKIELVKKDSGEKILADVNIENGLIQLIENR